MLIIFTVNDQKVTHDLGQRTLVAGSSGVVKAAFTFDNSWDGLDVVVVFSNSGSGKSATISLSNMMEYPSTSLLKS